MRGRRRRRVVLIVKLWRKARSILTLSDSQKMGVRVGVAAVVSALFEYIPFLQEHMKIQSTWIIITATIVQEKTAVESLTKSWNRLLGTIIGSGMAFLFGLPTMGQQDEPWALMVHAALLFLVIFFWFGCFKTTNIMADHGYAITVGSLSFAMSYMAMLNDLPWVALSRSLSIALGILIGAWSCIFIFPVTVEAELKSLTEGAISALSDVQDDLAQRAADASSQSSEEPSRSPALVPDFEDTSCEHQFDFRGDEVQMKLRSKIQCLVSRGNALLKIAKKEILLQPRAIFQHIGWVCGCCLSDGSPTPLVRRTPVAEYRLLIYDLVRAFNVLSMINPYLRVSIFGQRWGKDVLSDIESLLRRTAELLRLGRDYPVESLLELKVSQDRLSGMVVANVSSSLPSLTSAAEKGSSTPKVERGPAVVLPRDRRKSISSKTVRKPSMCSPVTVPGQTEAEAMDLRTALARIACLELLLRMLVRTQHVLLSMQRLREEDADWMSDSEEGGDEFYASADEEDGDEWEDEEPSIVEIKRPPTRSKTAHPPHSVTAPREVAGVEMV
jgi:hypothetical protein